MMISKNYYDDVNILYLFTSLIGNGYCVKRWRDGFDPKSESTNFEGPPDARWVYLDDNFKVNIEFIKKKREIIKEQRNNHKKGSITNLISDLNIERKLVIDHNIIAKFSLIQNNLSNKTLVFIQLEKLKTKINDNEINIESTIKILDKLV